MQVITCMSTRRPGNVGGGADTAAVAYDEDLAGRIRERMAGEAGLTEKRMFGGLAFLINGNMAVSASGQGGILLRVDPAQTEKLVRAPHARRFEMRGREMDGWLRIDPAATDDDADLAHWVSIGVTYARSLRPK
jgi:TfoX N-terminal domain